MGKLEMGKQSVLNDLVLLATSLGGINSGLSSLNEIQESGLYSFDNLLNDLPLNLGLSDGTKGAYLAEQLTYARLKSALVLAHTFPDDEMPEIQRCSAVILLDNGLYMWNGSQSGINAWKKLYDSYDIISDSYIKSTLSS